jgi:hypothetical protein
MGKVEWTLRAFRAAFYITPGFANWVRTRARELSREGRAFEIILVWGGRRFRVGNVPHGDPYFAIQREDGTLERSPYASD